ncbi:hypothetical protein SAMN05444162_0772 [Paenibacillaceae bacterium GAS479]|nr:hypothetical protein SAMN05444162_0772 [Paenibacillaceae bacterium GAS479]
MEHRQNRVGRHAGMIKELSRNHLGIIRNHLDSSFCYEAADKVNLVQVVSNEKQKRAG